MEKLKICLKILELNSAKPQRLVELENFSNTNLKSNMTYSSIINKYESIFRFIVLTKMCHILYLIDFFMGWSEYDVV